MNPLDQCLGLQGTFLWCLLLTTTHSSDEETEDQEWDWLECGKGECC